MATIANPSRMYVGGNSGIAPATFKSGNDLYKYAMTGNSPLGVSSVSNLPSGFNKAEANKMYDLGTQYQGAQNAFSNLYSNLVNNKIPASDINSTLSSLVDYSKQASNVGNQYNSVANRYFNPVNQIGMGGNAMANANAAIVPKTFTLPKSTWDMQPAQLSNWIQNYEAKQKSGGLGGMLSSLGRSAITGAALSGLGLDPITSKVVNAAVGKGFDALGGSSNTKRLALAKALKV